MKKRSRIPDVIAVEVIPPYGLHLTFDDGVIRDVDLAGELWGPVFESLKDPAFFAQVCVDHGTVVGPTESTSIPASSTATPNPRREKGTPRRWRNL